MCGFYVRLVAAFRKHSVKANMEFVQIKLCADLLIAFVANTVIM